MANSNDVERPLLRRDQTDTSRQCRNKHRIIDRGGRFGQSYGGYNIVRIGGNWRSLYFDAPFHTVINTRTSRIISGVFLMYFVVIFFFAIAYRLVRNQCNLGITSMMQAWLFSLETIMTIGYGAPQNDIFYADCFSMATLLTLESFAGIFLDSICIGIFYARFARAQARASTVIFSDYAIIRKIRGQFYFMFQTCERRKHQLVEAHIRCYAIRHDYSRDGKETALFQTYNMRLQQPDDDLGAYLLMALPQVVVHRIDPWSPLYPLCCKLDSYDPSISSSFPDPIQRSIDIENGSRESHSKIHSSTPTKIEIEEHIRKTELEVVVVLEGIDGPTSNTMQARHSYILEDMMFDHFFEPCVSRNTRGGALIDFEKFHHVKPAPCDIDEVVSPFLQLILMMF